MPARVFATEPEMFLLDEPTDDLDSAASHTVLRLLRETAVAGAAVVVVLDDAAALLGMRAEPGPRLLLLP